MLFVAARSRPAAFTLVEMLVVMGVIGALMGLLLPALASVRAESKSTQCLSNLRQGHVAVETARQQNRDHLPFAAPLPSPVGQVSVVPGLPERLEKILARNAETWMCPADETQDSEDLGTSYVYLPGAFMLAEPPLIPAPPDLPLSPQAEMQRVIRLITDRYLTGYLHSVPLLVDSADYHTAGSRHPRNAVFIDGNARVVRPDDSDLNPGQHP